jgi:hypothetical protein
MKDIWTRHLQGEEEKEQFRKSISRTTVKRLDEIVDTMLKDLDKAEISPKTYDIPNWDYRQAHNNGYRQSLSLIKSILDLGE